jgi:hypothetical protein
MATRHLIHPQSTTCAYACKVRYATEDEAQVAKWQMERLFRHPMKAYECPDCGGYHLATERYPERQAR